MLSQKLILLSASFILMSCLTLSKSHAGLFEGIRCNSSVPKAVIGKKLGNQPSVKIEQANTRIGLKNLGGEDGGNYFLGYWEICGNKYAFLVNHYRHKDKDRIKDVLQFPKRMDGETEFLAGTCKYNGNPNVIGFLKSADGSQTPSASRAWLINSRKMKFQSVPPEKVICEKQTTVSTQEKH